MHCVGRYSCWGKTCEQSNPEFPISETPFRIGAASIAVDVPPTRNDYRLMVLGGTPLGNTLVKKRSKADGNQATSRESDTEYCREFINQMPIYLLTLTKGQHYAMEWSKIFAPARNQYDVPLNRTGHTAVEYNHSVYVYGGRSTDPNNQTLDPEIYRFNILTKKWLKVAIPKACQQKTLQPSGRFGHTAVLRGSSMFVFGGKTIVGGCDGITNSAYIFDLEDLSWNSIEDPNSNPRPRYRHASVIIGEYMYTWGGKQYREEGDFSRATLGDMLSVWRLNLTHLYWEVIESTCSPIPYLRYDHRAVNHMGVMLIYGGCVHEEALCLIMKQERGEPIMKEPRAPSYGSSEVWAFDPVTRKFEQWLFDKYHSPCRQSCSFHCLGGELCIFGGYGFYNHPNKECKNDEERLALLQIKDREKKQNKPNCIYFISKEFCAGRLIKMRFAEMARDGRKILYHKMDLTKEQVDEIRMMKVIPAPPVKCIPGEDELFALTGLPQVGDAPSRKIDGPDRKENIQKST